MRPPFRLLLLVLGSLACSWPVEEVQAQSISLDRQGFRIRRQNDRPTSQDPDALSRQDCLDDDPNEEDYDVETKNGDRTYMEFAISLRGVNNRMVLEIWASLSADCTDQDERQGGGNCRRVYRNNPSGLIDEARVYPRIVVDRKDVVDYREEDTNGSGAGDREYPDESTCDKRIDDQYTFHILLFQGDSIIDSTTWEGTRVDTAAPPPPVSLDAAAGDETIFLEWEVPTEDEQVDTEGFAYYCVEADPNAGGMGGNNGGNPECPQSVLIAGELPSDEAQETAQCGSIRGVASRDGQIDDVDNGTTYAVAVAARDLVNNRGELSEIQCATPAEVTTFFERYREAGGKGGGGFCTTSTRPKSALLVTLLLSTLIVFCRRTLGRGRRAR